MKTVLIDGAKLTNRGEAHAVLKTAFGFPENYEANLDSLWDMLSTYDEVRIQVDNCHRLSENLGGYGSTLLDLLGEASAENERIRLILRD